MKSLIRNILIGADIEMFLKDLQTNEIVSAEGYIPGEKHNPFNFDPSNKYFALSLDNVAAEFCIPPVTNETDWLKNIKHSLDYVTSIIPKNLVPVPLPAANLHERFLQSECAKRFGCDIDFNVWKREANESPSAPDSTLRSCGGHIHVGYDLEGLDRQTKTEHDEFIIKCMDLFLGIPSVLQEPDNKRKLLYGKAGCFRQKEYGVEYRTISNYYLASDQLTKWAFTNTMTAMDFINCGGMEMIDAYEDQIQFAINSCDKVTAENIINAFDIQMA